MPSMKSVKFPGSRRRLAFALLMLLSGAVQAAFVSVVTESACIVYRDVVADAGSVYIAANDRVLAAPATGGLPTTLYLGSAYSSSGSTSIFSLTAIGNQLFWGDAQSGPITDSQILTAPNSGIGPVTAIYTGFGLGEPIVDITGIDTDGTRLYTADAVQGRVHALNPDGSGLVQVGPNRYGGFFGDARENDIAFGDGKLFVATSTEKTSSTPADDPASFFRRVEEHDASTTSGAWTVLPTGALLSGSGHLAIAYGSDTLFVSFDSTILELDLAGGLVQTITDPQFHDLRGLTIDSGSLFVTDNFRDTGRVLRVGFTSIPEPGTLALLGAALAAGGAARYRRRSS